LSETPLELAPEDLAARLQAADAPFLLDVREPDEHAFVHLGAAGSSAQRDPGAARRARPAAPLVAYCHHGVRSLHAVRWLRAQGFDKAQSLAGGIDA
jgi:rhodanese-related sulfurtransferase